MWLPTTSVLMMTLQFQEKKLVALSKVMATCVLCIALGEHVQLWLVLSLVFQQQPRVCYAAKAFIYVWPHNVETWEGRELDLEGSSCHVSEFTSMYFMISIRKRKMDLKHNGWYQVRELLPSNGSTASFCVRRVTFHRCEKRDQRQEQGQRTALVILHPSLAKEQ